MQLLVEVSTNRRSRKKENDKKRNERREGGKHKILCSPNQRPIKKELNYLKL